MHIGTDCADVSYRMTIDTGSELIPWMVLVIGSHGYMRRWMISIDGIWPGSLVASVSGLLHFGHLNGPGFEGLPLIVHVGVD